ncbi:hypothetical protein QN277_010909 [Acacia crassicarpa]|uniref:Uncharacterized protein n=1 Tax=Acacia crassicarpa TaxID=499986 RepID=A0AAE1M610_9FABA|nr:hypothetical protein QN277_010909 [Acacia crassicarpa]
MSLTPIIFFFFFFFYVLTCIFHSSHASTILVDGASLWNNPTVYFGDSIALPPQESAMSPDISPTEAPAPSTGADASPSSAFPWPFQPESQGPSTATGKGSSGMPFINSNPAVPLPTGEVDSATIRPSPTSADQPTVMIEFEALVFHVAFHSIAFLLPLLL